MMLGLDKYTWLRIVAFNFLWHVLAPQRPVYIDLPLLVSAAVLCEYWYLSLSGGNQHAKH